MRRTLSIFIACLSAISAARSADPDELVKVRAQYLDALAEARNPIKDKYLNQMKEMLTEFTQAGNLQEALAVREAIRTMEEDTPAAPTGGSTDPGASDPGGSSSTPKSPSAGTVSLRPADATLEGALKIYRGAIVYWIRPNCRARWHSRDVPAGKYDVYFVYSAGYGQGGVVEVRDFTYSFDVKVARTGYSSSKRVKVGTIETRGGIGMHITSKSTSKSGVMNLYEVQLVPAG